MKDFKDYLEVTDEPVFEEIKDKQNHSHAAVPPAVLIMRRKAVRQYPGNKNVALYYIDKLDKYVTVLYDSMAWNLQAEEVEIEELDEDVMGHLKHIVDNHTAKAVKFKDGKTMKVDVQTANAVLKVHGALNDENKKKVSDMAHKSKEHFGKVVDFAWKHLK